MTSVSLVFSFLEKIYGDSRRSNGRFGVARKITVINKVVKNITGILCSSEVHLCFNKNEKLIYAESE